MSGYDVVILGSGFGGSLSAAILAKAGWKVAVVDRLRHPRFAIGESSTPSADLILHDLAKRHHLPELLPLARFGSWRETYPHLLCGCKRGFSYFWHGEDGGFQPSADHRQELFVAANASREAADTQWYRPDVDQFFADVARNHSADVFEETEITTIEHPKPHAWTLVLDQRGTIRPLKTEFVIDATAAAGVLMRSMNLKEETASLETNSSAVYGHWQGLPSFQDWLADNGAATADHPFPCDDSAIHHLFPDGWTWQLRFENGLTSVGSVFSPSISRDCGMTSEQLLTRNRPALREMLAAAKPAEFPGRLFRTGRLQRLWNSGAGCDWAALPATIGFIDPLHSTGIAHTLYGIERLCEILLHQSGEEKTRALEEYSAQTIRELRLIDLLVSGCYWGLRDFRLFTTWTMLYFAAATCFEKNRLDDPGREAGFLLANDAEFGTRVCKLSRSFRELGKPAGRIAEGRIDEFQEQAKASMAPYNRVGLFAADVANMYRYTAAEKH